MKLLHFPDRPSLSGKSLGKNSCIHLRICKDFNYIPGVMLNFSNVTQNAFKMQGLKIPPNFDVADVATLCQTLWHTLLPQSDLIGLNDNDIMHGIYKRDRTHQKMSFLVHFGRQPSCHKYHYSVYLNALFERS